MQNHGIDLALTELENAATLKWGSESGTRPS
jgi:hypothetical protein